MIISNKNCVKLVIFLALLYYSMPDTGFTQWYSQSSPAIWMNSISFGSSQTAFAVGSSLTIVKTTNAGINWVTIGVDTSGGIVDLYSIQFLNENTGYVAGGNYSLPSDYYSKILKTSNGGYTWAVFEIDSVCLRSINFINQSTGFAGGWCFNGKCIFKTTNGGDNWTALIDIPAYGVDNIFFLNTFTGWAVGDGNNSKRVVLKTTNSGNNWFVTSEISALALYSVNFVNANTGWITGVLNNTGGLLQKSTDGGLTWIQQVNYNANELYRTFFINETTGWVVGDIPPVQKTTNGGINWYIQTTPVVNWQKDIYMLNQDTGFTVGCGQNGAGFILNTTNGGGSVFHTISGNVKYTDNNQPVTSGVIKAIKLDRSNGSIIIIDSTYIQSDGTYLLPHVPQDSVDIGLYPVTTPPRDYLVSYYPATIYWQDAVTLYPEENLTNINLSAIRIQETTANNSVNGKVTGLGDFLAGGLKDANVYAKNGGAFVRCTASDENGIYHLASLPAGTLKIIVDRMGYKPDSTNVIVTSASNIDSVNFYLNKIYVGVKQTETQIPLGFTLEQNYPNPFNPATNIKFGIPANGFVKLTVYNILGQETATLINETMTAGSYSVSWNASNYPSGVYFYRMQFRSVSGLTGDFIQTRKMALIK